MKLQKFALQVVGPEHQRVSWQKSFLILVTGFMLPLAVVLHGKLGIQKVASFASQKDAICSAAMTPCMDGKFPNIQKSNVAYCLKKLIIKIQNEQKVFKDGSKKRSGS